MIAAEKGVFISETHCSDKLTLGVLKVSWKRELELD